MATPDLRNPPSASAAGFPAEAVSASPDFGSAGRIGLWALAIGFGGFLLWAALAPLDEGVPSQGFVAIDTKRKAVQHLSGGIIKQVLVGEGDLVKEGQLLFKLDDAAARASLESVRQRYLGLRAMQGRLQAEQSGKSTISFHPDLLAAASDPLIQQQMTNQEQLMQSRRAALRADLQSIEESVQGQAGLLQSYESMLVNRRSQLALLNEELGHTRSVVKEGYVPRNRLLELERQVAEAGSAIAELQGNIIRSRRSMMEMRQRAIVRQQEYRKEIESQQAEITREVLGDADKVRALQDDLGRTDIRAPAAGQVVALAAQTVGGVIGPGQKLMDIVPDSEGVVLEAKIPTNVIDRVRKGEAVDVRFTGFAHTPQLVVDAVLTSLSGDIITEQTPAGAMSYYLARVQITPAGLKQLGERTMQPGMQAEVLLKTGERSLLTYLLHPLTKRIAASMKEE